VTKRKPADAPCRDCGGERASTNPTYCLPCHAARNRESYYRRGGGGGAFVVRYAIGGVCAAGHNLTAETSRKRSNGSLVCLICQTNKERANGPKHAIIYDPQGNATQRHRFTEQPNEYQCELARVQAKNATRMRAINEAMRERAALHEGDYRDRAIKFSLHVMQSGDALDVEEQLMEMERVAA
jgi:hypothetical protein